MGLHAIDEAKRCLNCKKPRCREGCPINTPIPQMIQMFLGGEMSDAAEMVFENNPLSVICSLVCDHEKQCEGHCVKGGTWRPYRLNIPGETFGNVHYGINYLNNPDVYDLGERVVVIGAGNGAMDVARTAIRKGSQYVTVYSVTEVPAASPKEVEYAMIDGVQFEFLQTAIEIKDDGRMVCDVEWGEDGKMIRHEETARFVPADSVIISISQGPQDRLVNRDKERKVDSRGLLKTDEKGETTMEGIFASGDVVTGAKTVVEAVKCSKMIADAMDEYVQKKKNVLN